MTEVAILKSDDSAAAMDLSVKCGRITLRRPPSMDQQPADAEETLAAFLHGPGRTRGLDGGMPPEWLQQHHRAVIYRPEFDPGHRYPSHFGPMIENSPEGVPRRNGYGAYPVEMRRHHHHRNNDNDDEAMTYAAMQAQRIVTSLPPFNYYVPEMHCSNNNDDDDDEFMTSSQSMTSSHLTKTDVDPSSAPDCFQFPVSNNNNNNNNIYDGDGIIGGGGVSSGGSPAGVSAVAPGGEQPMPNGPPSSVHVAPPSPIFFNPRKRFLAEIRKASGPQTSPSSEPNSTTGHHHLAPPTPSSSSSSSTDASTPSSTEEKRHLAGTRAGTREGTTVSSFPSTEKDEAYWERRRKNNEAAKRSRDIRRQKEEQVAARAASLSAENVQLRAQIEVLKTQLALIHSMVISGSHRQA